jgi:hypothetical protein
MHSTSPLFVLFASLVAVSAKTTPKSASAAQTTGAVVNIFFPGTDQQPLVGSVIGVDSSSSTTLAVACPTGTDITDCGLPDDGITLTQNPTTLIASITFAQESDSYAVTYGWECSLGGTTTADCIYRQVASITGSAPASLLAEFNGSTAVTSSSAIPINGDDFKSAYMPVTITAGAEKLSQQPTPAGSASDSGSAASTGSGSAASTGSAASSGSMAASGSGTTTTAASGTHAATTTGTGAAPAGSGAATQAKIGGFAAGGALMAFFML